MKIKGDFMFWILAGSSLSQSSENQIKECLRHKHSQGCAITLRFICRRTQLSNQSLELERSKIKKCYRELQQIANRELGNII